MLEKLADIERRFQEIEDSLQRPDITSAELINLTRERAEIEELVGQYQLFKKLSDSKKEAEEMLASSDGEMQALIKEEILSISTQISTVKKQLTLMLVPKDPNDSRNVVLEVRAGTGGDEAAIFASDLLRMYTRYADSQGWKVDLMSSTESVKGGFKEIKK